ncbi:MAG: hypothetical protein ABIC40_02615, partial [bacterium]
MNRFLIISILPFLLCISFCGCPNQPVTPPNNHPGISIAVNRLYPTQASIETVLITVTRLENESDPLPGRKIEIISSSGSVGDVHDKGNGKYDAIWTGISEGEIKITATDKDSDPPVGTTLTFLALEYLDSKWDVPVKIPSPISTEGWEAAPFLYPDGKRLIFSYITLDVLALAAGYTRSIGQERPGQTFPQIYNLYMAENPDIDHLLLMGWTVENAISNHFESTPTELGAPSVTSSGFLAFCTVQFKQGDYFTPSAIYSVDSDFTQAPIAVGPPVDMDGTGEDNPYLDLIHGWLYFDTYDSSDPLSKQDLWTAEYLGGTSFDIPLPLSDLNTPAIETQPFVYEPDSDIYFASDR